MTAVSITFTAACGVTGVARNPRRARGSPLEAVAKADDNRDRSDVPLPGGRHGEADRPWMLDAVDATGMEPVVDRVFDFENVREAYRYVDRGEHQGNVVVTVE